MSSVLNEQKFPADPGLSRPILPTKLKLRIFLPAILQCKSFFEGIYKSMASPVQANL